MWSAKWGLTPPFFLQSENYNCVSSSPWSRSRSWGRKNSRKNIRCRGERNVRKRSRSRGRRNSRIMIRSRGKKNIRSRNRNRGNIKSRSPSRSSL